MLSIIHISSSLGYLIGYAMDSLLGWKNEFYIQNIFIVIQIIIIILIFLPDKYFSKNLMPVKAKIETIKKKKVEKEEKEKEVDDIMKNKKQK